MFAQRRKARPQSIEYHSLFASFSLRHQRLCANMSLFFALLKLTRYLATPLLS